MKIIEYIHEYTDTCMQFVHSADSIYAMSALLLFNHLVYTFPYSNRTMYIILCCESFVCSRIPRNVVPFHSIDRPLSVQLHTLLVCAFVPVDI